MSGVSVNSKERAFRTAPGSTVAEQVQTGAVLNAEQQKTKGSFQSVHVKHPASLEEMDEAIAKGANCL